MSKPGRLCYRCTWVVTPDSPCPTHQPAAKARRQELDERRGSATERGYGPRWRKARATWLSRYPLCVTCEARGRVAAAAILDHTKPHNGDQTTFWLTSNWQGLCPSCDAAKKPRESGIAPCRTHGELVADVQGERICRDCGRAA